MKFYINEDIRVDLPIEYNYKQRLELVNGLLVEYADYLNYDDRMFDEKCGVKKDINAMIKYRLSGLATYLITSDEECYSSKDVMSDRKAGLRRKSEVGRDNDLYASNATYHISV